MHEPVRRHRLLRFLRAQLDSIDGALEAVIVPLLDADANGRADLAVARALRGKASDLLVDLEEMDAAGGRFCALAERLVGLLRWIATHDRQISITRARRRVPDEEIAALAERMQRLHDQLASRRREDLGLPP